MAPADLHRELRDLVAGFRCHLEWHRRAGAFAAPGGASARPAEPEPGAIDTATAPVDAAPARADERDDTAPARADERDDTPESPARSRRTATLADLRAELGDCQRCKLAPTRTEIVFGVGADDARLLFVGEAPGAEEDRRGEPFVGRAGQLLDRMIGAMGWTRESVYIANVLKCRPPRNRDPQPDEIESCEPFLARQIAIIQPRVIVTLGRPAAHLLLRTTAPIGALRGRFQSYRGIPVMPTFHPAFLLRSPEKKREAWSDLKSVIAELDRIGVVPPHAPKT